MGLFNKSCYTNTQVYAPSPDEFSMLDRKDFKNGYVLMLKYDNCNNYEGKKILVYKGQYKFSDIRDPHFCKEDESPFARFKPTKEGWKEACKLAKSFT